MAKRINNQGNKTFFYPNTRYRVLLHKLNKLNGLNSVSRTIDDIIRDYFDARPDLVSKLEKLKLEDNE